MEIKYIDIHSHFNLKQFEGDLSEAIKKIKEKGVATICVGTDLETSKRAVLIAEKYDFIWATIGQHPTDTKDEFNFSEFEKLAVHPKVVAIGECGFDYFRTPKDEVFTYQLNNFLHQIRLSQETKKPLMVHARPSQGSMDAYVDTLDVLQKYDEVRANFHFFVGNQAIAQRALDQGHTMSFDGPITFTEDYNEVLRLLPLESIMAETDSPYAAPEPYRGGRAEPWMVEFIYKKIAEIRGEDEEEVRIALNENASKFFNILF